MGTRPAPGQPVLATRPPLPGGALTCQQSRSQTPGVPLRPPSPGQGGRTDAACRAGAPGARRALGQLLVSGLFWVPNTHDGMQPPLAGSFKQEGTLPWATHLLRVQSAPGPAHSRQQGGPGEDGPGPGSSSHPTHPSVHRAGLHRRAGEAAGLPGLHQPPLEQREGYGQGRGPGWAGVCVWGGAHCPPGARTGKGHSQDACAGITSHCDLR